MTCSGAQFAMAKRTESAQSLRRKFCRIVEKRRLALSCTASPAAASPLPLLLPLPLRCCDCRLCDGADTTEAVSLLSSAAVFSCCSWRGERLKVTLPRGARLLALGLALAPTDDGRGCTCGETAADPMSTVSTPPPPSITDNPRTFCKYSSPPPPPSVPVVASADPSEGPPSAAPATIRGAPDAFAARARPLTMAAVTTAASITVANRRV